MENQTTETVLVLRTCNSDMTSYDGFKWPESGPIEAPDWKANKECGNGLHGWLWGNGDWQLKSNDPRCKWLVVEVEKSAIIDLGGKIKFPQGRVVACEENWWRAMSIIRSRLIKDCENLINIATGDSGHASATGKYGWSIAGYNGRVKAASNGVLTALYYCESTKRPRVVVGYVGEDGIEADIWYEVKNGKLVKCVD